MCDCAFDLLLSLCLENKLRWMHGLIDGWMIDVCLIRCRSTSTDLEIKTLKGHKNPPYSYLDKNVKITAAKD